MNRNLGAFSGDNNFSLLRKIQLGIWFLIQHLIFRSALTPPSIRTLLLKLFGATIGNGVLIRSGVRVHFPWNLTIGDDCWVGEEVWFINHEQVTLGSNVCVSQRSTICSGGHDYRSSTLEFSHMPVEINDGAWVCLDAKVLPGVTIGKCSVISAGEVVRKSVPDFSMLIGGQIRPIEPPK